MTREEGLKEAAKGTKSIFQICILLGIDEDDKFYDDLVNAKNNGWKAEYKETSKKIDEAMMI